MTTKQTMASSYRAIGAKEPLETMEALVRAVFDFANGNATPPLESRFGISGLLSRIDVDSDGHVEAVPISLDEAKTLAKQELKAERHQSSDWLNRSIRAETGDLAARVYAEISEQDEELAVGFSPVVIESKNKTSVRLRATGPDWHHAHWTLLAVAAIAANHEGIRDQVSYCHLEGCRKVFFIEHDGPGRKRRKYCCDEHLADAHRATATERVRRSRERKREAAKEKTTRRRK